MLPDDMFADVTEDGFAYSFWMNIDGSASQYSRIFSATVNGQNSDSGWPWTAPEFAFVAGSENATDLELLDLYSPDGAKSLDKLREQQYKHGGIV